MQDNNATKMPVLFLSHGGGPLPLMEKDPWHGEMRACFAKIRETLPTPKAIVMVSAHWEENAPTVQTSATPPMLYDYYGFPPETYHYRYDAAGAPECAQKTRALLEDVGFKTKEDPMRGFDHGAFVPLMLLFPEADIPVFQLSQIDNMDSAAHIKLGAALQSLRDEDVLIIGSGGSFHNIPAFFQDQSAEKLAAASVFSDWLDAAMQSDFATQESALLDCANAPHIHYCHPRIEHLLPLHVCAGVAQDKVSKTHIFKIRDLPIRCYEWL